MPILTNPASTIRQFQKHVLLLITCAFLFLTGHSQLVYTVAGTGEAGYNGDSIRAKNAMLNLPQGLCFDKAGNLIISENRGERVRKYNFSNGMLTNVAGTGEFGYAGDGGPATAATFYGPIKVAIDSQNNMFILDHTNGLVRKIDGLTGIITKFAGNNNQGEHFAGDGGPATNTMLNVPLDIDVDKHGNVYVADYLNNRIRKIDGQTGIISTVAGNGVQEYTGDNILATAAGMRPISVCVDSSDNIFISDYTNYRIRKVDGQTGIITTVFGTGILGTGGDGGLAVNAQFNRVTNIELDKYGNLYLCDEGANSIRKINAADQIVSKIIGVSANDYTGAGFNGDGNLPLETMIDKAQKVVIDNDGNIYLADTYNHRIRKIDYSCELPTGANVYTFTGNGNWSDASNWYNNAIPPPLLPANSKIIINPAVDGECILDTIQTISFGGYFIVKPNKKLTITGSLNNL